MGAVGLQTHIWGNNLRSILLLAGFPVLLIGMIWVLQLGLMGAGYLSGTGSVEGDVAASFRMLAASAPLALLVAGVWFVVAYFANQKIIDLATGAHRVERTVEPELYNLLENLALSRGMRPPQLRIIESEAMNAFASGINERQYTVTVTRGLMQALTPEELEAVLAHELTHVINRDVRTMVIAAVFAGIITLLSQVIYRGLIYSGGSRRSGKGNAIFVVIALAVAAVGYLLAIVIRLALSRSREFVADAGSVELTKNPDAMISALRKVAGGPKLEAPEQVRGMFFDNQGSGAMDLFATHPAIEKRIAALIRFGGGRDEPQAPGHGGPWG